MFSKRINRQLDLSVIIVTYRSGGELLECLHALSLLLSHIHAEVIVVHNDRDSRNIEARFPFGVTHVFSEKNIGFGAAGNIGAMRAKANTLLFLNPDARVISGDLQGAMGLLRKRAAAVGFGLIDAKLRPQMWATGYETNIFDILLNNVRIPLSRRVWTSSQARTAHWISGAALLIRKKIFFNVGGFDERFFLYFEDMDLCYRLRRRYKAPMFLPNIRVVHRGGKSFHDAHEQKQYYYASQLFYFQKNRKKWEYYLLRMLQKLFL